MTALERVAEDDAGYRGTGNPVVIESITSDP
jgi:hypothetical protein